MRSVKRSLVLGTAMLALALPGAAFAASDKHLEPGVPGTPGCRGQTTAYLAQAAKNGLTAIPIAPGLGNLARAADLTTAEVQEIVRAYCAA